ncbi:hypothetical protein F5Y15DRAFT_380997 [Xylariaceae sp. FL0016]|nr:hypothetical protein F5Y15DRAFT_380997 [Xylariaceae sp. FL0016]
MVGSIRGSAARECRSARRSRFGCRNCKLRKVKCGEERPRCQRCISFGVSCNFMPGVPDLHPVAADEGKALTTRREPNPQISVAGAIWTSDELTSYQVNVKCQNFITRYLGRSLITPHDSTVIQMNRKFLELALTYPSLMHASLAVSFTYDRYLNSPHGSRRSLEECYHRYQSTALLSRRLKGPIAHEEKDAIWGTAAALAVLACSSPDASTPEDSWPLKSSSYSDWGWLSLSEGKMSLWHTVNPLRPDSLFHVMAATFAHMFAPLPETGIDGIHELLVSLCCLDESSSAESSPYFDAAHAVSQILNLSDGEVTTGHSQVFPRCIHGPFKDLLRERDPAALLLLYLWYRKASHSIWWIELRYRVEGPSICSYLRLYHQTNATVQTFLPGGLFADEWT